MSHELSPKDRVVLDKLIERIKRTLSYCKGLSFDAFESQTMLQEACVFNILQIGELSKQSLNEAFIAAHPELPWRQMNGLRNHIVHGYEGVRLNIVWDTITGDFPALLKQLDGIA